MNSCWLTRNRCAQLMLTPRTATGLMRTGVNIITVFHPCPRSPTALVTLSTQTVDENLAESSSYCFCGPCSLHSNGFPICHFYTYCHRPCTYCHRPCSPLSFQSCGRGCRQEVSQPAPKTPAIPNDAQVWTHFGKHNPWLQRTHQCIDSLMRHVKQYAAITLRTDLPYLVPLNACCVAQLKHLQIR